MLYVMKSFSILWTLVCFSLIVSAAPIAEKTLSGHVPPAAKHLTPVGRLSSTNQLRLAIGVSLPHRDQLTAFVEQLYDPANPNYRHYLTPQQFTERFGATEADYEGVIAFALRNHFKIKKLYSNRMLVDVTASVGDLERALKLTMRVYQHPTEPRTFYAPDAEPSVPANLAIADISGLNNYLLPRPKNLFRMPPEQLAKSTPKQGTGTNGLYQGNDFRAAYAPGVSLTGAGQTVALLEFDGYTASDIASYESIAHLPSVPLQNILIDGADGSAGPGNIEVALDIEMAVSMAPGLSQIRVYEAPNPSPQNDLLNQMVTDDAAKQISSSWGWGSGPQTNTDAIFLEMAAQGQTFFNAAGDSDAFTTGSNSVNGVDNTSLENAPSSCPYITQVGGTELTTTGPGGSWESETVWNSGGGEGSSGGISSFYSIPTWQTGISMTANHGSLTNRNIPDVAMTALNIFVVFTENGMSTNGGVGGTSCAAPLWAGFTALANQQAAADGKAPVGFLNPTLYAIGKGPNYSSDFHDITTGNNYWSSSPANFPAVAGYDLCTGWGTPAGMTLIDALLPDDLTITPSAGFAASGPIGGPFTPSSLELVLTNTGTATLNWSLANAASWLSASPSGGSLAPGGPATIVTVSVDSAANSLSLGTNSASVSFTDLNDQVVQNVLFSLTVEPLLLNGGFELGNFTDWTLNGSTLDNYVDSANSVYSPHSGTYLAMLGQPTKLSYLSQTIGTVPGQLYLASFWLISDGKTPNQFLFSWNGKTLFNRTNVPSTGGWSNLQFVVQATAGSTVLEFGSEDSPSYLGLDDVSLQLISKPTLESVAQIGTSIQFSWGSLIGAVYQLQYNTNLATTNWINLGSSITASNSTTSLSTPIAADPQRFYRLLMVP